MKKNWNLQLLNNSLDLQFKKRTKSQKKRNFIYMYINIYKYYPKKNIHKHKYINVNTLP